MQDFMIKTLYRYVIQSMHGHWYAFFIRTVPGLQNINVTTKKAIDCPIHGPEGKFRMDVNGHNTGAASCTKCGDFKNGIEVVMHYKNLYFVEAMQLTEEWIGLYAKTVINIYPVFWHGRTQTTTWRKRFPQLETTEESTHPTAETLPETSEPGTRPQPQKSSKKSAKAKANPKKPQVREVKMRGQVMRDKKIQAIRDYLKKRMKGLWQRCIAFECPDFEEAVEFPGKPVPCPMHMDDGIQITFDEDGCNTGGFCCPECGTFRDGFAFLMWANDISFIEALDSVQIWFTHYDISIRTGKPDPRTQECYMRLPLPRRIRVKTNRFKRPNTKLLAVGVPMNSTQNQPTPSKKMLELGKAQLQPKKLFQRKTLKD